MNQINSVRLRHELHSDRIRIEGKTCLDYWRLEFGYCLFFVIWCLEFIKFKDSALFRYPVRLFNIFVGYDTRGCAP